MSPMICVMGLLSKSDQNSAMHKTLDKSTRRRVMSRIDVCDVTYVWCDYFLWHMCDVDVCVMGLRPNSDKSSAMQKTLDKSTRTRVVSHLWIDYVTHDNESCHTCEWIMPRTTMSHVTHVNSRHAYGCVALCQRYALVMSHMWLSHDTNVPSPVTWHIRMCDIE